MYKSFLLYFSKKDLFMKALTAFLPTCLNQYFKNEVGEKGNNSSTLLLILLRCLYLGHKKNPTGL